MKKSLSELDQNFKLPVVEDGLAWHSLSTLEVEGLGWAKESDSFCRLPDRAQGIVREPVWELSRHSAGVLARFFTDATQVSARWSLRYEALGMDHMAATGVSGLDLYVRQDNQWRWVGVGRPTQFPENEVVLLQDINHHGSEPIQREYLLYLPLYNGVSEVKIGINEGADIRFEMRESKPICVYGTSIVQGGCASRPGMSYPAILGRRLECPVINLGFSGNGQAELEVASLLAELDPSIFVIDCLPNLDLPQTIARIAPFVQTLRSAHPNIPIVLVENITYIVEWIRSPNTQSSVPKNAALKEIYRKLKSAGIENLYYVSGDNLLGDDGEGTVDGVHPTDVGFMRMADVIEPILKQVLSDE